MDLTRIAADKRCEGFSGADMAALVREAALQALREAQHRDIHVMATAAAASSASPSTSEAPVTVPSGVTLSSTGRRTLQILVEQRHFDAAFRKVFPSVSDASRQRYERMHQTLCRARAIADVAAPSSDDAPANGVAPMAASS